MDERKRMVCSSSQGEQVFSLRRDRTRSSTCFWSKHAYDSYVQKKKGIRSFLITIHRFDGKALHSRIYITWTGEDRRSERNRRRRIRTLRASFLKHVRRLRSRNENESSTRSIFMQSVRWSRGTFRKIYGSSWKDGHDFCLEHVLTRAS